MPAETIEDFTNSRRDSDRGDDDGGEKFGFMSTATMPTASLSGNEDVPLVPLAVGQWLTARVHTGGVRNQTTKLSPLRSEDSEQPGARDRWAFERRGGQPNRPGRNMDMKNRA